MIVTAAGDHRYTVTLSEAEYEALGRTAIQPAVEWACTTRAEIVRIELAKILDEDLADRMEVL